MLLFEALILNGEASHLFLRGHEPLVVFVLLVDPLHLGVTCADHVLLEQLTIATGGAK